MIQGKLPVETEDLSSVVGEVNKSSSPQGTFIETNHRQNAELIEKLVEDKSGHHQGDQENLFFVSKPLVECSGLLLSPTW